MSEQNFCPECSISWVPGGSTCPLCEAKKALKSKAKVSGRLTFCKTHKIFWKGKKPCPMCEVEKELADVQAEMDKYK